MSVNDIKLCPNCGQNIDASKFFLHERMCSLNIKKCPKCNKPFTVDELEEHMEEAHGEAECEYCKKKFPKMEIENHKKKCDSKMVPCSYCELDILLSELKEHQKACGAISEPCEKCGRYIQRKEMERHLLEGCPPPKNDRRSVEVVHNSNNKYSLGNNNQNLNNYYNYFPINDFLYEDILDENKGKIDIKTNNNIKPSSLARPASTKKVPKNNNKKHINKTGNNKNNKEYNDVKDIINKKNSTKANNNDKNKHSHHLNNNNKINENSINIKVSGNKNSINEDKNKNNINDKGRILLKPAIKSKVPINPNSNHFNKTNNSIKHSTNTNKGNLKKNSKEKISEKEMRKTKEKEKKKKNNEVKILPKSNNNNINNNKKKGVITDEDYIANYNFEVIDEEQFLQQAIEQSIRDQAKK